jgi:hypothetical protein
MSATAELLELVALARELKTLLQETKVESTRTEATLRQEIALLTGVFALTRKMNLPDDVERQVTKLQKVITTLTLLRATALSAQAAMGPLGWAMIGVNVGIGIFAAGDMMESLVAP